MTTPGSTRPAVTQLLGKWSNADEGALGKLLPLIHPELHQLAHHYMSLARTGHKLQTTAVLNEAYLQLENTMPVWQGRTNFIAAAAQIMRHIVVAHARGLPLPQKCGDMIGPPAPPVRRRLRVRCAFE